MSEYLGIISKFEHLVWVVISAGSKYRVLFCFEYGIERDLLRFYSCLLHVVVKFTEKTPPKKKRGRPAKAKAGMYTGSRAGIKCESAKMTSLT